MNSFTHLHVHSQYSILDGAATIEGMVKKIKANGMTSLALTDHGNMCGIKHFHKVAKNNGIKPILGVEAYMARNSRFDKRKEVKADKSGYHLILLAKNFTGYKNLIKLCSLAQIEGLYYTPRIDKELLEKYHEGLIAASACLGGEIPQKILTNNEKAVEEAITWYKTVFKDDFYLEIMRHPSGNQEMDERIYKQQEQCNNKILNYGKKYGIDIIATNDSHFLNAEDAKAHDLLICLKTGKNVNDRIRMRYTGQEYLKTKEEMRDLFNDVPDAFENTNKIAEKVELYNLNQAALMPDFAIPAKFVDANHYLKHLTYKGAEKYWGNNFSDKIKNRLDYELETIKKMGFPGYFLIIWDFLNAAKEKNVIVGPGRGSAAGSAVAYCMDITNIDPIKHNLLFERFLNPGRISMPDIDIDLDDEGRQKMLDWVADKYGYDKVAQIVTFGRMGPRVAIRDVSRVLELPLSKSNQLANLVPKSQQITFRKAYRLNPELLKEKKSDNFQIREILNMAESLEGAIRQRGIHASGIIICKDKLINHIPLMQAKDSNLLQTQYEFTLAEEVGMLKMDFLGLKTLSIIKDTIENVKKSKNIIIDLNAIPFGDKKTFELFSKGETMGVFQFENPEMQSFLKELKPNRFEDIYSMTALYRPGPKSYIPTYIKRKNGKEKVTYDHPLMEKYLRETYGITVYQEQVMMLAVELAGFTRSEADTLRKAMGKKIKKTMDSKKEQFTAGCLDNPLFIDGCNKINQNPTKLIDKIWHDWEAFADYAFNKSHAVSYSYVAFYIAYLKAHYPEEFMIAILSRNWNDLEELKKYLQECKRMNISILCPDINQSFSKFNTPEKGIIRFGLSAIKGIGEKPIKKIIEERKKNGKFKDIYDFFERVDLRQINKSIFENIASVGGFECLGYNRNELCRQTENEQTIIENLIHYGQAFQGEKDSFQPSLFGEADEGNITKPTIPKVEEWSIFIKAKKEKELIGIYLTVHPLDEHKRQIDNFTTATLADLKEYLTKGDNKSVIIGGFVVEKRVKYDKNNNIYGIITIEDYTTTHEFRLFHKDFKNFYDSCDENQIVIIKGELANKNWGSGKNYKDFKISEIMTIELAEKKLIKQLQLKVDLQNLNEKLVEDLKQHINGNKGSVLLRFSIFDKEDKLKLTMISYNKRIKVDQKLFNFLKKNKDIDYQFN